MLSSPSKEGAACFPAKGSQRSVKLFGVKMLQMSRDLPASSSLNVGLGAAEHRQEGRKVVPVCLDLPVRWDFAQENKSMRWTVICAHRWDVSGWMFLQVLLGTSSRCPVCESS